jgi:branched-chain amino acid transport system permease protein
MDYVLHISTVVLIYVILAVSLDLVAGKAGMLSLSHAAFFGIGAYSVGILGTRFEAPFVLGLILGVALSCLTGLLVSLPALRVKEDFFAITTFACQVIAVSAMANLDELTGGPLGIAGIRGPRWSASPVGDRLGLFLLLLLASIVIVFVSNQLAKSPFGRVLRAIREDEKLASAVGKQVSSFRVRVFVFGAGLAAIAGSFFAAYMTFIDPTSFTVMESILILAIVVVGAGEGVLGSAIAAAVLVLLPEMLRFTGFSGGMAANLRQVLFGLSLVIMVMYRPAWLGRQR